MPPIKRRVPKWIPDRGPGEKAMRIDSQLGEQPQAFNPKISDPIIIIIIVVIIIRIVIIIIEIIIRIIAIIVIIVIFLIILLTGLAAACQQP